MQEGDYLSLLQGLLVALAVAVPSIAIGIPLGLGLALIRWGKVPFFSQIVTIFVSFARATPSVTLVLLLFYAAPGIGLQLPELSAGILTLTLGTMAYNCEIWRAGLLAFPKDQYESAKAMGMRGTSRFWLIVLPQLWRTSLPALVNEMTLLIKVTPAIAVIGLVEVTRAAVRVGAETYQPLPPFFCALVIYLVIIGCMVGWQRWLEHQRGRQTI